ncbi:Thiol-activated cytolysin [Anatilimnocola aggregata]|uniref:Thiol-activated cytolysin n=1 Tax=Anatilimnocola aggregata TaxID=2528021 RepID=A0A517YF51_9BACT|nr:thiol-activated cytolysin family protein [Anatilimnocola aggregata]QDU28849.1 Thiol-activated cytolysin [Anatilimnocola aggregata]
MTLFNRNGWVDMVLPNMKELSCQTVQRRAFFSLAGLSLATGVFAFELPPSDAPIGSAAQAVSTDTPQTSSSKYLELQTILKHHRPTKAVTPKPTSRTPVIKEVKDGKYYLTVEEQISNTMTEVREWVLFGNDDGFVYPGSRIFVGPLREGRFVPVQGKAPMAEVPTVLVGAQSKRTTFVHDGTFFGFQRAAAPIIQQLTRPAQKSSLKITYGASLEKALSESGLSVGGWGVQFSASRKAVGSERRSFAVLSLSEAYYTIVADITQIDGMSPATSLDADPILAKYILSKMKEYGEIGFVRSVKYGRRAVIVLSAAATEEELKRTLRVQASGFGLKVDGHLDDEQKRIFHSMEAEAVIIGGKASPVLGATVTGGPEAFLNNVNQFLADTVVFDAQTAAVPISFEVRFAFDNEPMADYRTAEFAGQIVTKRKKCEETVLIAKLPVELTGQDARLIRDDQEVFSNDWTAVDLSYTLAVSSDQRHVMLAITLGTRECENDRSYRGATHIQSSRQIRVFSLPEGDTRKILSVKAASLSEIRNNELFGGELLHSFAFPNTGALYDIVVRVDGKSGEDLKEQSLKAIIDFSVEIDREH